ncbi:MAG TPA: hypothetical protein VNU26_06385 [Mycobacteriales bacterium]|nr:hypothetical protein [Mycobacteriales bacterium]
MSARRGSAGRWTTRRFGLDSSEWITSAAAACVSTSAYLRYGREYLAPGVAGDLIGFGVLAQVLRTRDARLRHEAVLCLGCIGAVLAGARHPGLRRVPEAALWGAFAAGLTAYLHARRRICQ